MDLTVIDSATFLPIGAPIQNYISLIWNERFQEDSDFELTSYAVEYTRELLPIGTLVSHRESREIMQVQKHTIELDDEDVATLRVTGTSLTRYLEHRVLGEKRDKEYQYCRGASQLSLSLVALYNVFVNTQAWDITQNKAAYYKDPKDAIPNTIITDSTDEMTIPRTEGPVINRWIKPGTVREAIKDLLLYRPYGLRILRPPVSSNRIDVNLDAFITSTYVSDMEQMAFDIYKGVDRSYDQTAVTPVILDTDIDDLMSPNYVFSDYPQKSCAQILLDDKSIFAYADANASGLDRRIQFVDGSSPEEGYDAASWEASRKDDAASNLVEVWRSTALIDGAVSPYSKIRFGTDYFLGDVISVRGQYGMIRHARVTEYIRTESEEGEEGYPTLFYL